MKNSSTLHNNIEFWRISIVIILLGIVVVIFTLRLFNLQVIQYDFWSAQAMDNKSHEISIPTARGTIYDRNGIILANNIPSFNIVITPADLPDDDAEIQEIFRELSELTGLPVNLNEVTQDNPYVPCTSEHGINQIVGYGETTAPFEPVRVDCDVDRAMAMMVKENSVYWPGVSVQVEPVRDYPTGSLTASIIGFLGPIPASEEQRYRSLGFLPDRDKVGYAGAEFYFQDVLAGTNGLRTVEWDVAGKIQRNLTAPVEPEPGDNIHLTIDVRLQQLAESILLDEIDTWNRWFGEERMTSGVVIAMNPQTGEILAMISYPTYENNRMARVIPAYYYEQLTKDKRNPLLNHAVGAEIPAGSVFKLVTATGVLNEGVVTPEQVIKALILPTFCTMIWWPAHSLTGYRTRQKDLVN
jgi:penicillin-binding protein 2